MKRATIEKEVRLEGVGLHTGVKSMMTLKPYENKGLYFIRTDIKDGFPLKAALENVSSTLRGTNLSYKGAEVHTAEHIVSAACALGITDMLIELDGPEPPVMDGSSIVYAKAMLEAGFKDLGKELPDLELKHKVEMQEGDIYYSAEPAEETSFTFLYTHAHPLVSRVEHSFKFNKESYLAEISPARTFGFEEELEFLRKHGLAKGGSVDNAVVVMEKSFSSQLRFDTEMARHKILDMIGDLALMNTGFGKTKFYCRAGGHKYNIEFAKKLLKENGHE